MGSKSHSKFGHDFGMHFYDLPSLQSDFKNLFGNFMGIWHTCFLPKSPPGGAPFARGRIIQRPQDCNGDIQHAVGQRPGEVVPASTCKSAITQVTPRGLSPDFYLHTVWGPRAGIIRAEMQPKWVQLSQRDRN